MWGAALFFITMMLVTQVGRGALDECARQTMDMFAAHLEESAIPMAVMVLSGLASMLLMISRTPKASVVSLVWQEVRGELGQDPRPR